MRISDWSSDVCSSAWIEVVHPVGREEPLLSDPALRRAIPARRPVARVEPLPHGRLPADLRPAVDAVLAADARAGGAGRAAVDAARRCVPATAPADRQHRRDSAVTTPPLDPAPRAFRPLPPILRGVG